MYKQLYLFLDSSPSNFTINFIPDYSSWWKTEGAKSWFAKFPYFPLILDNLYTVFSRDFGHYLVTKQNVVQWYGSQKNWMSLHYWKMLFLSHNIFNLNKISSNLTSKIPPNHYSSSTIMLNSWHNTILTHTSGRSSSDSHYIYFEKSSNLDSSVHCTFFQSSKVQSLCCYVL